MQSRSSVKRALALKPARTRAASLWLAISQMVNPIRLWRWWNGLLLRLGEILDPSPWITAGRTRGRRENRSESIM